MKRTIHYFVSYAHADRKLADKLLAELEVQLGPSKDFEFKRWRDSDILLGEKWHDEIQSAIKECDFGLLLVSPAFLSSDYVHKHELPQFVSGQKLCMPVALCRIDFEEHDLKGLADSQLYRYRSEGAAAPRAFADYSGKLTADFAHDLFKQITARLKKVSDAGAATVAPAKPSASMRPNIPNNLPRLQYFFGRDADLKKIADALAPDARGWGALIDGPGGIGKTALAIRAAELVPEGRFRRIIFLSAKQRELTADGQRSLGTFVLPTGIEMLNAIARELEQPDLTKSPEAERPEEILRALREKDVLLVLDNLEKLLESDRDQLFAFLNRLPSGTSAIVTSRRRADAGAVSIRLDRLDWDSAHALMSELGKDFIRLAQACDADRRTLYDETGGNPLLIRWVAGHLGYGRFRTVAAALGLLRSPEAHNNPLEFIFGDLLDAFTEPETKVLATLTHFIAPVAAKFVALLSGINEEAAQGALADLSSRALVLPDIEDRCFLIVPLVANFLRRKKPEVVAETGDRLEQRSAWIIMSNGYRHYERFEELEKQWPSIAPCLDRILAGPNDRLQRVCAALRHFMINSGRWDEWRSLCLAAEQVALKAEDYKEAGWRAYQAGFIHFLRSEIQGLEACAARTVEHWRKPGVQNREIGDGIRLQGLAHYLKGDNATARELIYRALQMHRNDPESMRDRANDLHHLAEVETAMGDVDLARKHYDEHSSLDWQLKSIEGEADRLGKLADLSLKEDNFADAEAKARGALRQAYKACRKDMIALNSCRVARAVLGRGLRADALPFAQEAVKIYTFLHMRELENARAVLRECEG